MKVTRVSLDKDLAHAIRANKVLDALFEAISIHFSLEPILVFSHAIARGFAPRSSKLLCSKWYIGLDIAR
jgi:hypothetical protein